MPDDKIKTLVRKNSLFWGNNVASDYHGVAAAYMQYHWDNYVQPTLERHSITYGRTIDFACGYGRNTDRLLAFADHVTMIDVNKDNIEYCRKKYAGNPKIDVVECNGYDLSNVASAASTFLYTFDSVVHFPFEIVKSYIPEFYRVLMPGGHAFIHHSNYTAGGPKRNFRKNPQWRNYMSAEIFGDLAKAAGFEVVEQTVHTWGDPELDCVSVLRKR